MPVRPRSSRLPLSDAVNEILAQLYPLAPTEEQTTHEPGWDPEYADSYNSIYVLPNRMRALWMEDGPDNGDRLGRGGLFVFPDTCFVGKGVGQADLSVGYYIDENKPGWRLRFNSLLAGKVLPGVERVGFTRREVSHG